MQSLTGFFSLPLANSSRRLLGSATRQQRLRKSGPRLPARRQRPVEMEQTRIVVQVGLLSPDLCLAAPGFLLLCPPLGRALRRCKGLLHSPPTRGLRC
ncbi:hypothetical protein PAHAL_2G073700 [Panicum hallii]|uniref:Uncharacterized protein n=1 Tax=Panicum hallii TaxID=206008 RepID=A0A2T8KNB7_9POAL|nr:hypothetical protein PAHAL_2G073700 [Panicum hallii]